MRQPSSIEFHAEGISALNDLLDARELTGQVPETMPTGLYNKDNSSNDSNDCNCNCNCNCNCGDCSGRCFTPIYAAVIPGSAGKWK